ncbi:hypothetical protein Ait01nite_048870 [Actinoplanes italicus]|nr:hypothetical protein Ait01nite_048870 [Actinoplanes italicus]
MKIARRPPPAARRPPPARPPPASRGDTRPGFACAPDVVGYNGGVAHCGSVDACRRLRDDRVARNRWV